MGKTVKQTAREIRREELITFLKERGKLDYVFDIIVKLEDPTIELDALQIQRLRAALDTRVKLLGKYLPDVKAIEMQANVAISSADSWSDDVDS